MLDARPPQEQLGRLLDTEDAQDRLRRAFNRLPDPVDRSAVAHLLLKARWRREVFEGTVSANIRHRQRLARDAKRLRVAVEQAWRGLLAVIRLHENLGVRDRCLKAYRDAALLLLRDPMLALDRDGAEQRARLIAGRSVGIVGGRDPSGVTPHGGPPRRFSLAPVRQELRGLGVRGDDLAELLAAAGLE